MFLVTQLFSKFRFAVYTHQGDLLGGLNYSDAGYAEIARKVLRLADQYAQGRTVWVLEGGYVPANNAYAVESILQALIVH